MVDFCTKTSIKFSFLLIFLFFKLCWYKTQINSTHTETLFSHAVLLQMLNIFRFDFNEDCWIFRNEVEIQSEFINICS